jgi:uncharacterized lipoprotein YddW (UPF0748 family)
MRLPYRAAQTQIHTAINYIEGNRNYAVPRATKFKSQYFCQRRN